MKNLVSNMLQLDPSSRKTVKDYRERCENTALGREEGPLFPEEWLSPGEGSPPSPSEGPSITSTSSASTR